MKKLTIPTNLSHKPIVGIDYQEPNHFDAKFISIGHATWDYEDISIKVFRKPSEVWSRQSEEIPPERLLDMAAFLISEIFGESFNPYNKIVVEKENEEYARKRLMKLGNSSSLKHVFKILAKHIGDVDMDL